MIHCSSKTAARTAAVLILAVVLTGCQQDLHRNQSLSSTETNQMPGQASDTTGKLANSPQQTYNSTTSNGSLTAEVTNNREKPETDAITESSIGKKQNAKEEKAWDPQSPKLKGITLGDNKSALLDILGKPADSYTLGSGNDVLQVNEYTGFSIGYNTADHVAFIEIFASSVSTGLNGLKVGSSKDATIKALGKPTSHTTSVLAYEAEHALLKIDLDPEKGTVVSIKLFQDKQAISSS